MMNRTADEDKGRCAFHAGVQDQVLDEAAGRSAAGDRKAGGGDSGRAFDPGAAGRDGLAARPSPWPTSSSACSGPRWCWRTTRRWRRSSAPSSRSCFPDNAVEYFVSYYDYYQPEAYIATTDTYIEKDASINDEIDRLRHSATAALRRAAGRDHRLVGVAASTPWATRSEYEKHDAVAAPRDAAGPRRADRAAWWKSSTSATTSTSPAAPSACTGDVLEIFPRTGSEPRHSRIEFFGDEIDRISEIDPVTRRGVGQRWRTS